MARNYKRDRNGKFAKVSGGLSPKGRKKKKATKARANAKLSPQKRAANRRAKQDRQKKIGRRAGAAAGIALAVAAVGLGTGGPRRQRTGTSSVSTNQNAGAAVRKISSAPKVTRPSIPTSAGKVHKMDSNRNYMNKRAIVSNATQGKKVSYRSMQYQSKGPKSYPDLLRSSTSDVFGSGSKGKTFRI